MSFQNAKLVCKSANPEEYHKAGEFERGDAKFVVSSSMLRLFAQCPSRWIAGYESPESDAKKFGSLLDTRLLTPEQFKDRFAVRPATYVNEDGQEKPFNLNSKVCKKWVEEQGEREIVTPDDIAEVDKARARIMNDETIAEWFNCSDKQVWVRAEWNDESTKLVIPIKILLDFVPRIDSVFAKSLGDLKAIRSGAIKPFSRQVFQYGWHTQAAFYQDVYAAAMKEDRPNFMFIVQENYAPFEPGRRLLSEQFLEIGRATYVHALKRYCRCLKSCQWPGYDLPEEFSLVIPDPWMEFEAMEDSIEFHHNEREESTEENFDIIP